MAQLAYYQQKLKQGYDANVKLRPLTLGDLVLWRVVGTAKNLTWGGVFRSFFVILGVCRAINKPNYL